jgi:hypothetical protein
MGRTCFGWFGKPVALRVFIAPGWSRCNAIDRLAKPMRAGAFVVELQRLLVLEERKDRPDTRTEPGKKQHLPFGDAQAGKFCGRRLIPGRRHVRHRRPCAGQVWDALNTLSSARHRLKNAYRAPFSEQKSIYKNLPFSHQ